MKKNYTVVSLVQAFIIIASVLLFPVTAHSQDLTAEQKRERCQNNKNRIAELETQLRVIDADLSKTMTEKEMENAKYQMGYIRKMRIEGPLIIDDSPEINRAAAQFDEFPTLNQIAAQYNFRRIDDGSDIKTRNTWCIELEKLIANKIDKAVSLQNKKPELINKKNEINKQLAFHRNNLIALACDITSSKLSGKWGCNDGGAYIITQNGNNIVWEGVSADQGKTWSHRFEGEIKDDNIVGTFKDHPPGAIRNSGPLTIKIINNNRLEKVSGSNFGGSVWTR